VTGELDALTADQLEEKLYNELQKPENDAQLQAAIVQARKIMEHNN
jgi:hypothetical protein